MIFHEQFLTIELDINEDIKSSITQFINQIKTNKSHRIGSVLVHDLKKSSIKLPKIKKEEEKQKTKWEIFAEKKGIEKKKKNFFVFDEKTGERGHRYGALSEKNKKMRAGLFKKGESYSKLKREKRKRIEWNQACKMKNVQKRSIGKKK